MLTEIRDTPTGLKAELERRLFNLKTLYDVSHELLGHSDVREILKNFMLMTMGNFGVMHGFVLLQERATQEMPHFQPVGFEEQDYPVLLEYSKQCLTQSHVSGVAIQSEIPDNLRSLLLGSPVVLVFEVDEQCTGLMCLGPKLVGEEYSEDDEELLRTMVNNLVIALKNARYSEALREALEEIRILNSAKDKVINHLAHELKTPVALLAGCVVQLQNKLPPIASYNWQGNLERAQRSLTRLQELQWEAEDIMRGEGYKIHNLMSNVVNQCADALELMLAERLGEGAHVDEIRNRIEEMFGPKNIEPKDISLDRFVVEKLGEMRPSFSHRQLDLITSMDPGAVVHVPPDPLEKVVKGIVRNAIENTPDQGKIEITARRRDDSVEFAVRDYGIGILPEHQERIFEGFFPTQDTYLYRSGKPYHFNAGGRGADLLRMKIFSERFNFSIGMSSQRCRFIPNSEDSCPGRIGECEFCKEVGDCYESGGTTFEVVFPVP
jgi:signal transduction histidine kinase